MALALGALPWNPYSAKVRKPIPHDHHFSLLGDEGNYVWFYIVTHCKQQSENIYKFESYFLTPANPLSLVIMEKAKIKSEREKNEEEN